MNKVVRTALLAACWPTLIATAPALSAQETTREGRYYAGILGTTINHRSVVEIIEVDDTGVRSTTDAWGSGATLVFGKHITDLFHVEVRAGLGLEDAELRADQASLEIDHFASWYIGLHYPVTSYANIFGQFGFSYIEGEAQLNSAEAVNDFPDLSQEFPGSSFSVSWLAGLDVELIGNTYLVFEAGRLFKDTETDVNAFQFSSGLRYEF